MSRLSAVFAICTCLFVTACSGQQSVPSGSATLGSMMGVDRPQPLSAAIALIPDATKTPLWGIGLSAEAQLHAYTPSFNHDYCQQPEPQGPQTCPLVDYGKRTYTYSMSKTVVDAKVGASAALTESATSNLGSETYSVDLSATSSTTTNGYVYAGGDQNFAWNDTLTVKSSTLKKGSPVTLSVALVVTPTTTAVECGPAVNSGGFFTAYGTGFDSGGSQLGIYGECANGSFVYTLNGPGGPIGTTDTGTLTVYVGRPAKISFTGGPFVEACGTANLPCIGAYSGSLAGSMKWSITGVPPGVTYTTASGTTYQ